MFKFIFLTTMISLNSFASEEILLKLRREKPFIQCDISANSVKITRVSQGVKFSKTVSYQIEDFKSLIKDAFDSRTDSSLSSEHFALNSDSSGEEYFNLSLSEPKNLKLINLISTLCELRHL